METPNTDWITVAAYENLPGRPHRGRPRELDCVARHRLDALRPRTS
ncbi:hypothetical protein ACRAWF_42365 [Streptomyces sp. L7]